MTPTALASSITRVLRRRRGLTEQAAVAAVDQACRQGSQLRAAVHSSFRAWLAGEAELFGRSDCYEAGF